MTSARKISQTIFLNKTTPGIKSQLMIANIHNLTRGWQDATLGYELRGESSKHSLFSLKEFICLWSLTFLMIMHLLIWSSKECTREYTFGVTDVVLMYMHFHSSYLGILGREWRGFWVDNNPVKSRGKQDWFLRCCGNPAVDITLCNSSHTIASQHHVGRSMSHKTAGTTHFIAPNKD